MTYPSPVLGKVPTTAKDYAPIPLETMEHLLNWARWVSVEAGAPVYLVGSVLHKPQPRDIDVAIIWPLDTFERLFEPVPREDSQAKWDWFWAAERVQYGNHALKMSASHGVGYIPRIDVKCCPDVWFPDQPKLLIAHPGNAVTVRTGHNGEDFYIPKIVRHKADETGLLTNELDRVLWDPAWLKEDAQ